jgi:perosamine synthetase
MHFFKQLSYQRCQVSDNLALNGGYQAIRTPLGKYKWVDNGVMPEIENLILSNSFSGFLAQASPEHFGGPNVQKLEMEWSNKFNFKYSVSFNSWTSGLMAAVASLNLEKDSEVIVTPWTMSATVACIVANNLIPVFADIEEDTFNIDPIDVASKVTKKTSAIMAVDIFGKPCNAPELSKVAKENNLYLVVDSAQTPRAKVKGKRSGNYSDISGYSLNRHKHIQVGEGGIAVTDNTEFAERMRLIRNHAEASSGVIQNQAITIGHNWRMGEIEAVLANYQLKSFDTHIDHRFKSSVSLINLLSNLRGIKLPEVLDKTQHDFYIIGIKLDDKLAIQRDMIAKSLVAEGVSNLIVGYQALHRLNAFSSYRKHNLRIVEKMHDSSFLGLYMCGHYFTDSNVTEIYQAFDKVLSYYY